MKLTRIRLEQLKRFRQPIEISNLAAGLNLFTGPNEAGKSTIVAAIRAAFFERHRSGSVDGLRPWGDASASPTVEIDFDLGGQAYRLRKRFLVKRRCELQAGALRLDGVAAEDHLAGLLGFQHAAKGVSAAQHWGIPGLLWIEQGAAQELRDPVVHASDHLRSALNESLGEVASSGGDDVLARVEALRAELLTTQTGAPRGPYAAALEATAGIAAELAAVDEWLQSYRAKVDSLASLRQAQKAEEAAKPWRVFRQQEQDVAARLVAVRGVTETLARERLRAAQLDAQLGLLRHQLDSFASQDDAAVTRRVDLGAAQRARDEAEDSVARWTAKHQAAAPRYAASRETLRRARQLDTRRTLLRQIEDLQLKADSAAATLAHAEAQQARLLNLQREAAVSERSRLALKALREQHQQIRELEIRQAAAATRLRFKLADGAVLQLGNEHLGGHGERLLLEASTLTLPGLGTLEIAPGGADLAALARQRQRLADSVAALLQGLGLDSLEAAEQRQHTHERQFADLQTCAATLKALAPKGLDALRNELGRLEARLGDGATSLAGLPDEDPAAAALPAVSQAESEEEDARTSLEQIDTGLNQARLEAANAQSAHGAAQRELDLAQALLGAPERAARLAQARQALVEAKAEQATLAERIAALRSQVDAARPELLAQDLERHRNSAELHERQFEARRDALMRLEVELQAAGAQGLDERRAEGARDLAQAQRRVAELQRRARALDHLLTLLRAKRQALTRRLQAPLQDHLNRYLSLLFPNASLEIDEHLRPGPLTRGGADSGAFESSSFGTREQMGVIARLAYADLLQAAGRPTLIILDDALVHSDAARLAQMKRVLFEAATRHQILLFTCHPANWYDLGVAARAVEAMR